MNDRKLRIGWFTFTCCEDSTIVFTELLNTHWQEWTKKIDFVHANVLKTKNRWEAMDVAFVEGAICSPDQEEKLKKIRSLSQKIVTIGACACNGQPSGQRNNFNDPTKAEIHELLVRFNQADKVKSIKEVVPVDDAVNGCPMLEQQFLSVLNKYLLEFGIN
jgi:sulfhydrogenase subunit delta